ncbi:MAG: hypothetical protein WBQ95_04670 [Terracidiphilus sp.]
MSSRASKASFIRQTSLAAAMLLAATAACAQYPGQVTKKSKDTPDLRAIGVLEWTGDEGKPKTSRLVPITVYDGQALQDGNVYLARPEPLALAAEVEYELEQNGMPIGLYDIKHAGQEQGLWVGYGAWKPLPSAKATTARKPVVDEGFDPNDDKPVLHRKHGSDSGNGSDSGSSGQSGPAPDPDRPTLHKKSGSDSSTASTTPASGPDQPGSQKSDSTPAPASAGNSDPDRPVLHKSTQASADSSDGEHLGSTDPDRPRLLRGKPTGNGPDVLPSLMGLPADMQQAVAISDAKSHPEHPWSYTWANPEDEGKMKEAMEVIARQALGLKAPPAATPRHTSTKPHAKPTPPPAPPPLVDERFRVFELAYGSGATMVLSARTDAPLAERKYVTLIAQPDLYGNPLVLLKNVTDASRLDDIPRMRLVDAVDALADNRGELLFELRGTTQRQFALYRVLRGTAEKIFVTGGVEVGIAPGE